MALPLWATMALTSGGGLLLGKVLEGLSNDPAEERVRLLLKMLSPDAIAARKTRIYKDIIGGQGFQTGLDLITKAGQAGGNIAALESARSGLGQSGVAALRAAASKSAPGFQAGQAFAGADITSQQAAIQEALGAAGLISGLPLGGVPQYGFQLAGGALQAGIPKILGSPTTATPRAGGQPNEANMMAILRMLSDNPQLLQMFSRP